MIKQAFIKDLNKDKLYVYFLPQLTYKEFCYSNLYSDGASNIRWEEYLKENHYTEFKEVKRIHKQMIKEANNIERWNIFLEINIEY